MKTSELRDQSIEDLQLFYEDSCKKLFDLKNERSAGAGQKLEKPHLVRDTRKAIARALTIIHEKKILANKQSNS